MTNRENALAILRFGSPERIPVCHFGFWPETIQAWRRRGLLREAGIRRGTDGSAAYQDRVAAALGFDFCWDPFVVAHFGPLPPFIPHRVEKLPGGGYKRLTENGVLVMEKPGAVSIPMEFDHLLKDRRSWERHYRRRFRPSGRLRIDPVSLWKLRGGVLPDRPIGLYCGSLVGQIRDLLGVENLAYMTVDDDALLGEIFDAVGEVSYRVVKLALLKAGSRRFDFGHFWEDISCRNGPLVSPGLLEKKAAPHYRRITGLLAEAGVDLVSLDSDGMIDALLPIWLDVGVNVMFPVEVGTWGASIAPWRAAYGRRVMAVGGMDKRVFSRDRSAVDAEIERLKPLVDLGGYLPCPDHRIAPDAVWDNVKYYCERFRAAFG